MPSSTQDAGATGAVSRFSGFARSKKGKTTLVGLVGVVALSVGGSTWGYQALAHDVTVSVDGERTQISSHADTVGEVLAEQGIEVGEHDLVAPDADTELQDGSAVTVAYGRELTLEVDGQPKTYWVTSRSVDRALDEIDRDFNERADFSTSRDAPIGRDGLEVEIVTPKHITVALAGKKPQPRTVTALTVDDALAELEVRVEKRDTVAPKPSAKLRDGDRIVFTDVSSRKKTVKGEKVGFETVERSDPSMYEDEEETVQEGRAGARTVTYRYVYRNGKLLERVQLDARVTRKPVDEVVKVGTKERPEPERVVTDSAPAVASGSVWDRLAACESGGNWQINTGNGYYGGLQFSASSWHGVGGTGLPHQHSREEQIKRGQILQSSGGWGHWPSCAAKLGLL